MRIVTGAVFIGHGLPKFGYMGGPGLEGTAGFFGSIGLPAPDLMAMLGGGIETFGGIGLILGLFTRPFAILQMLMMLVAIALVHASHGMFGDGGYQWALLLAGAAAALMIEGGGRYSLDNWISDRL